MRSGIQWFVGMGVWLLVAPVAAQSVTVEGTVDVEVVNAQPIEVEVPGGVSVTSLPAVQLEPSQALNVVERAFLPGNVLIVQSYRSSGSAGLLVTIPRDMILRAVTVSPGITDPDPGLDNCTATVRWLSGDIHPASSDRYLVSHSWPGDRNVSLNYAMPYPVLLPEGMQLETSVSRVGTSGFCEALVQLTGTVVPEKRLQRSAGDGIQEIR